MSKNRFSLPSFMRVCTQRLTGHAISSMPNNMNGARAAAKNLSIPAAYHRGPHMRKALMLVAGLLAALPSTAQVTPLTECGAAGTGYVQGPTGRQVLQARTAEQAAGTRVAANGEWTVCDAPAVKLPVPCPGTGEPRTWSVGSLTCTSAMKGGTLATDPSRDRGIADGDVALWRQWTGANRGHLIERCVAGQRVEIGKTCAAATHCDSSWALIRDNRTYVYNAAARPVPIGGRVDAKSTDGRSIGLWCGPGAKFSIVR